MHPGMEHIIIPDPGHGASILPILLISDGDSDGATAKAGSASDLDMVMDMVDTTDTATGVADGGVPLFIIPHAGVDIMAVQGLTDSTETISMSIITFMLTMRIMYTETGAA